VEWFEEVYESVWTQRFAVGRVVYRGRTDLQEALVFENPRFGRVLVLDGLVQTTERDEFFYHEMLAHVPVLAHGDCRDVLIVGGGDGGTLEEVLKHGSVRRVTMVEIDGGVVELCRTHLASICRGAFDDPRLNLVIGDGAAFVRDSDERFDALIVDSTDPVTEGGGALFDDAFYAGCARCLRPGGVLASQGGNPFVDPAQFGHYRARAGRHFADVGGYLGSVPSYQGGPFLFGWASHDPAKRRLTAAELAARPVPDGLRCYTPELHAASFALPVWLVARPEEPERAPASDTPGRGGGR
jgi:spermidine synthase